MKLLIDAMVEGFPVRVELEGEENMPPAGYIRAMVDALIGDGLKPLPRGGAAAAGGASAPAQNRPAPQQGWACPVHGDEAIGPGYGGHGTECKVWTDNPDGDNAWDWIQTDRDGNPKVSGQGKMFCKHKAPSAGGNRGGGGGYQRSGGGGGYGGYRRN